MTYRWKEHVGPGEDWHLGYRERAEAEPWVAGRRRCRALADARSPAEVASGSSRGRGRDRGRLRLRRGEPVPGPPRSSAHRRVPGRAVSERDREPTSRPSARRPTRRWRATRPSSCFGLDVDDPKAIQGTTRGLLETYGPERVFGTPLSEDAMTGVAIGMALAGLRPIHVHIRMDFLLLAMNQLVNVAAKSRYMYGGQVHVPLVVRSMIGKSWGQGAQHSQGLYSLLHARARAEGRRADQRRTTPRAASSAAIRDDNPVMFVEHRLLHFQNGPGARGALRRAVRARPASRRPGADVTLVGISHMQVECLRARRYLEDVGIAAEVIDPIWLAPARHRHHRRLGRADRPAARGRQRLDDCGARRRDRRARRRAPAGRARPARCSRLGFAPDDLPDDPEPGGPLLPQRPHHRRGGPRPGRGPRHRLAARSARARRRSRDRSDESAAPF